MPGPDRDNTSGAPIAPEVLLSPQALQSHCRFFHGEHVPQQKLSIMLEAHTYFHTGVYAPLDWDHGPQTEDMLPHTHEEPAPDKDWTW